jgi:aspartyl/glutamyl-tRNA(Asn/Gln) amidotransferase C subunit
VANKKNPFLSPEGVARIAELARLRVAEGELAAWAAQMERIVAHVDRLNEIPEQLLPEPPSPPATPLRLDEPERGEGASELACNAREMAHGQVVVPRVVESGS